MSAFLGKIHYWLYNKIQLHESLIEDIINRSKEKGYNGEELLNESYSKYGCPVKGSLEDNINHDNIHGWLQERIISVETRLAYIITEILKANILSMEEISKVFYESGVNAAKEVEINEAPPQEVFNLIFNYMLEGMPCDRVNQVVENNESKISWITAVDIHKDYWDKVEGDVKNFDYFRDSWISGFLSSSVEVYRYFRKEDGLSVIERV
ncbi:hypothetical protein [Clostridium felsineum]|uniref:Uncharacterized protein n=1 Tax=Clostridium felsineum TaxID=36839 RepID=A0A1S8LMQ3_9CLOT|nr:hypothetical protein [Clostridium felsineum]URZ01613.1 hypothetical protein CLAUR_016080 [Clostridium felsineum]URZ05529.1 hypothetical protein CLROS_008550 [Clostridium felsineum]URZ10568.1 hypothetical protein CROST_012780 [Clostridium felsineum]